MAIRVRIPDMNNADDEVNHGGYTLQRIRRACEGPKGHPWGKDGLNLGAERGATGPAAADGCQVRRSEYWYLHDRTLIVF